MAERYRGLTPSALLSVFRKSVGDEDPSVGAETLPSGAWSSFLTAYGEFLEAGRTLLVILPTSNDAERVFTEVSALYHEGATYHFPAWETLPFERVSPSAETVGTRMQTLSALVSPTADQTKIVIAPVKALLQRLNPEAVKWTPIKLERGGQIDLADIANRLVEYGYRREYQVEHRGEFSIRGSIIDVFPSNMSSAMRIDLFGDEIESMVEFDTDSQRSLGKVAAMSIFPTTELVLDEQTRGRAEILSKELGFAASSLERIAQGEHFDGAESWLPWLVESDVLLPDLLAQTDSVVLVEPSRLRGRAIDLVEEEASLAFSLASTWKVPEGASIERLHLDFERLLARFDGVVSFLGGSVSSEMDIRPWGVTGREHEQLISRIRNLVNSGSDVIIAADNELSAGSIVASLTRESIAASLADAEGEVGSRVVVVPNLPLTAGFVSTKGRLALLSETELSGRRRAHRSARLRRRTGKVSFEALVIGGYVVHDAHGVARYQGMVKRTVGDSERDYLLLEYKGGDRLYVPSDQMGSITPYVGGEQPTLSRLGGNEWQKVRSRVKQEVQKIAQELVVLYQRRIVSPGHSFTADSAWQQEVEALFPFELTRDQAKAITEVKDDMEKSRPMDRLVCGDVGFGKTEIAIRAAFKAVQDGKQVAVLVPTTLLAQQHHQTFSERFSNHPVRVEVLSRFLSNAQVKVVLRGLTDGSVDVVVGTHRLLGSDVKFRDLGLLVVDEEQRFGVNHKEAMKKFKEGVDVLTLTATPIPRTLEMSLTGIRDLSILNTPPSDRRPILTHVSEFDELAVAEAVRRELLREGQVFYVHNRVRDIEAVASWLQALVPEAKIAVAHGQMDESTLERVVLDFADGQYDVLVCTTIIESGIDMPTVNTLISDRADLLGLGQLHQLRGRVGRSGQRAYAYLFYPRDVSLSEEAYERLRTIGESTELGSGFRIAMRDLEIRGAGNLLGESQSGHMAAVGYDLYVKMVQEAVAELKGEKPEPEPEINLDIPAVANIPDSYIEREDLRLSIYRRLADARSLQDVDAVASELLDRFGPIPDQCGRLLQITRLRTRLIAIGVTEFVFVNLGLSGQSGFRIQPVGLPTSVQMRVKRLLPNATYRDAQKQLAVPVQRGSNMIDAAEKLVDILAPVEVSNAS